ncbi:hypothetical protein B0H13DRAFT_1932251 [Mycena leptocephala]|nr:hypothetical protein B0H13DRAFT_1932251 [Mycena leptocephala]
MLQLQLPLLSMLISCQLCQFCVISEYFLEIESSDEIKLEEDRVGDRRLPPLLISHRHWLTYRGIDIEVSTARMEGVISLEHSLADVLTALAHYEAVLRRSRGLYTSHTPSAHGFPSDLDVTDGGEPQVPDSGDWMAMNFASRCEDAARGSSSACELARFRTWTFPRAERNEPQETDPSGLCFEAQGINSGMGISSDPRGFPLDTGGPIHDDGMWYVYTRLGIALEAERNERSKMAEYLREVLGNAQRERDVAAQLGGEIRMLRIERDQVRSRLKGSYDRTGDNGPRDRIQNSDTILNKFRPKK